MNSWSAPRCVFTLLGMQCVAALIIYFPFLLGDKYFAFYDIGSDTFFSFTPMAMHLAEYFRSDGFPGWSHQVGLGASLGMQTDPFLWLAAAFGSEAVLGARIWVFLLKVACGGVFFLMALRALGIRAEAAVAGAFAYSFCGYMLIDGQWDPSATEVVFFALLFWGLAHHRRTGGLLLLPLAVAAAAISGPFMPYAIAVFLVYAFAAELLVSGEPAAAARAWITRVAPLVLLGILLAAPIVIPSAIQLLDSPRVAGQTGLIERMGMSFWINNEKTLLAEFAGLWHKSLLGVANQYRGFVNFLEGPGFYVGVLPLLLLSQLWRGEARDRRWLVAGLGTLLFYLIFPWPRLAAFGFGVDYFRVSTLWVAMLLLLLCARAYTLVLERGVDRRLLLAGACGCVAIFVPVVFIADSSRLLNQDHALKIAVLMGIAFALLWRSAVMARREFVAALLAFIVIDAVSVGWFDVNMRENTVNRRDAGYNDAAAGVLKTIAARDSDFYRVEKSRQSVSYSDALAQGYRGARSYYYHGSGVISFHIALGLLPARHQIVNYTNWLHGLGSRFSLYSLLGVKYLISHVPLDWPGFHVIARGDRFNVYLNEFAMPLGIVQYRQLPRARFDALPLEAKDALLMQAVVTEVELAGLPVHDPAGLNILNPAAREREYFEPARRQMREGLRVEHFSNKQVVGTVNAAQDGVLVFSIPESPGWSLRINGEPAPIFRANLGMLAARIPAGNHRLELSHARPYANLGLLLAGAALLVLIAWVAVRRRVLGG